EDRGSLGEPDVGVAGGVVALVALGLDDGAADAVEQQPAADQLARHLVDRALEEVGAHAWASRSRDSTAAGARRAAAPCAARGAEPVPPAIRFDSSQLERCRTS